MSGTAIDEEQFQQQGTSGNITKNAGISHQIPVMSESGQQETGRRKKLGHRRVDEAGKVTYKKKPSSEIIQAIQQGVYFSVGHLEATEATKNHDVIHSDFSVVQTAFFPKEGSNLTPAHPLSDFRFKTYAPMAFRYFRQIYKIDPKDFLISLTSQPLKELSNPGASGSIFYITNDDEFIVKTVQHKEAEFLQKLLPGYFLNINQNPRTLLPKFYGLYCYQCGGKNIRFCVMNNLLPSGIKLHEKYDLKGSTYKRKASKEEIAKKCPTLKDLDFHEKHQNGLKLESETYNALLKTINRDVRVLASFKIMDYSLLMGIHNLDEADEERELAKTRENFKNSTEDGQFESLINREKRNKSKRIADFSTAMEQIDATVEPVEVDNENIPTGGIPARNSKGQRLLLFIGIIDILQNYRLRKKLEHGFKSIFHDGDTISVVNPRFYADRFERFFRESVFKKTVSLDGPEVKGPHLRFRRLVQLAMRQSPAKKKSTRAVRANSNDLQDVPNKETVEMTSAVVHPQKSTSHRPDLVTDLKDAEPTTPVKLEKDPKTVMKVSFNSSVYTPDDDTSTPYATANQGSTYITANDKESSATLEDVNVIVDDSDNLNRQNNIEEKNETDVVSENDLAAAVLSL